MKRTRILKAVRKAREQLGSDYLNFYADTREEYSARTVSGLTMKWYGLRYARKVAKIVNSKINSSGYKAVVTENSGTPGLQSMHIERI
jgi:hypothetical protein